MTGKYTVVVVVASYSGRSTVVVSVVIGEVVVMVVALNDIICTEIGRSSYSFIISSIIVVVAPFRVQFHNMLITILISYNT